MNSQKEPGMHPRDAEQECRNLVIAYGYHSDHFEFEAAAALFVPEGRLLPVGKPVIGRAAIVASLTERLRPGTTVRHALSNIQIHLREEGAADGVTYYIAFRHASPGTPVEMPLPLGGIFSMGEYHDKFVRTPDGWRILERKTVRVFQGTPS